MVYESYSMMLRAATECSPESAYNTVYVPVQETSGTLSFDQSTPLPGCPADASHAAGRDQLDFNPGNEGDTRIERVSASEALLWLREVGGLEIAAMSGAMMQAAEVCFFYVDAVAPTAKPVAHCR